MQENSSKSKFVMLIAKPLLALLSVYVSIWLIEFTFRSLALSQKRTLEEKCGHVNLEHLSKSRVYPFSNSHYQPMDTVDHCGPEWNYTYHIDENGLRVSENPYEENKILAVGDSFTFGFGVEDNEAFASLMGAYNAGMWSAPFNVQFEALKRDIDLLKPETVIWSFYPAHIISMMPGDWASKCPGDRIYFQGNSHTAVLGRNLAEYLKPILKDSYFADYVLKNLDIRDIKITENSMKVYKDCYATKEIILYDKNLANNSFTDDPAVNSSFLPERDAVYKQIQGYFSQLKTIAEEKNIKVYFVIIPSRLNLKLHEGYRPNYKNIGVDPNLSANTFTKMIVETGFDKNQALNLSQNFLEGGGWKQYYFARDAHWNASGHEFVSKVLKSWIKIL